MKNFVFILIAAFITNTAAFAPVQQGSQSMRTTSHLQSSKDSFDPLDLSSNEKATSMNSISKGVAASVAALALHPIVVMAGKHFCFYYCDN